MLKKVFLLFFSFQLLVVAPVSIPHPAEACFLHRAWQRNVWNPIRGELRRFSRRVRAEASRIRADAGQVVRYIRETSRAVRETVVDFIKDPSLQGFATILHTAINTVTHIGCSYDEIGGNIPMLCVPQDRREKLKAAYRVLNRPHSLRFNGINMAAYRHFQRHVSLVFAGDSLRNISNAVGRLQGVSQDFNAYYVGENLGLVVFLDSAFTRLPNPFALSSLLLHEADHGRAGQHSAGDDADSNGNGPYGTQLKYLALLYRHGSEGSSTLPTSDCDAIKNAFLGIENRVRSNQDRGAVQRILNQNLNTCQRF